MNTGDFAIEGRDMFAAPSRKGLLISLLATLIPLSVQAEEVILPILLPGPAAIQFRAEARLQKVVERLDQLLDSFWAKNKIKVTDVASDAEFLRRVSLDLIGQIPLVSEVREFLASADPHKRKKKIDELLNRPAFLRHYSNILRREWVPQTFEQSQNFELLNAGFQFEGWVKQKFKANQGMDQMVREMLTAPTQFARNRPAVDFNAESSPGAFIQANEFKPENVAAAASRLFVGIKLECAQCHNHKFAPYKQEQFWEQAAFFADVQPAIANLSDGAWKREIKIPETTKVVQATFFDGKKPQWKEVGSPREVFVDWLVSESNPYFSKNMANRTWAYFFGYGLIDPIDEPGDENQSIIPEVHEELAKAFLESKFDLRFLMRAITRSKAYQLSSKKTHESQNEPRTFSRMSLKGLTAEQIFDSLAVATGYRDSNPEGRRFGGFGTPRGDFLVKFGTTERKTEQQTSILQALTLMNGKFVNEQTHIEKSRTFAVLVDAPFLNLESKIEILFLTALSRKPTQEEMEKFSSYVGRGGVSNDKNKALADVFWALLNSTEFILNH